MIYRISSFFNGLGDCLQLSTLPEMLTEAGHKVYLLNDPEHKQVNSFRNYQTKQFVWDYNPFIIQEDFTGNENGIWNCGDLLNLYTNSQNDFIKNWEAAHGLEPKNSFPKIYYKPQKVNNVSAIIELSSISLKYNEAAVKTLVKEIIRSFPGFTFQQIVSPNQNDKIHISDVANLKVTSLFELYDVLCSCKCFISLNSGSHSVAAAAKEHNPTMLHYCIMPTTEYYSMIDLKRFIYPGVTYLKEHETFI